MAEIDANGKLIAKAVAANTDVTITAEYTDGVTKSATKKVKILALASATAEISDVTATPRWPFSSLLDIDYTLTVVPDSARATIGIIGRDGDHGVEMAARAVTGDGANGAYATGGRHRITWDVGADYPGLHAKSFSVSLTAAPSFVAVPENWTASNDSTAAVVLSWNAAEDATGYEIWRGGSNAAVGSATKIATITDGAATSYSDTTAVAGTTYRYWIRALSDFGEGEFSQPVTGQRIPVVPDSITISGPSSVTAGGTATYTCVATRNDGTSGTVTSNWSITSGGSYASISASGVLTANGTATQRSVTIQASYTQNGTTKTATKTVTISTKSVTISFNGNGGTASIASSSYTAYGPYGELPTATYTGYMFAGWFTEASGGTQVTTASTVPATATTLFAHWTINTYTIRFDANGGTGTMSDLSMTYGTAKNLTNNDFTRTGHTFAGWATSASGSVVYANGESVNNLTATQGAVVTLYAKWTPNTYTIRFNANGGSGTMSDLAMTYGTAKNLTANGFTRTGHSFAGWATSADGDAVYADGASVDNLTVTQGAIVTLYAKWVAKTYTLTINPNGGTLSGANFGTADGTGQFVALSVTYGANYYYDLGIAVKSGYTFGGWWTSSTGGEQVYDASGRAVPNSRFWNSSGQWQYDDNVMVYAHWNCPTPTLTISASSTNVVATWTASTGAARYEIYRGNSAVFSAATKIGSSSSRTYTDTPDLSHGNTEYYYWVRAIAMQTGLSSDSDESNVVHVHTYRTPGTYSMMIPHGNHAVTIVGAGGGGIYGSGKTPLNGSYIQTVVAMGGGSGAGFCGVIDFWQDRNYNITIGEGGIGARNSFGTVEVVPAITAGNGGATSLIATAGYNVISAGGGGGAANNGGGPGSGGKMSIGTGATVVSSSINSAGNRGTSAANIITAYGGSSVITGTVLGGGGSASNKGNDGFFQIVIAE